MKKIIIKTLCWFLVISYLSGCTTTEIIQYKAELKGDDKPNSLVVLTKDSTEYVLDQYSLNDTLLVGKGTVSSENIGSKNFQGSINIKDIVKIEGEKTSVEKTILGLGVLGLFLIAYLNTSSVSDDGHTIKVTYVSPGGGGGCMYH